MHRACRLPIRVLACFSLFLLGASFAQDVQQIQWAPVPFDANEPVTGGAKALTNPQERSAALQLLDRARQNYTFYGPHQPPFTLKVSFTSSGQLQYEGQGSMEETWTDRAERWTARIGSTEITRMAYAHQMWSDDPSAPVPMRVQMVRDTILWPVINPGPRVMLRAAAATIEGRSAMCILSSGYMSAELGAPRHWVEKEYCIDPETGNLLVWSEAPGHFVVYDYTTSTQFQGHLVANDISVFEAGARILKIHVDSLSDANGVSPESLRPTQAIMAKGPSFGLTSPMKFPIRAVTAPGAPPTTIQSVFVHATIDRAGQVIEAEALQNSNPELAAQAIETVRNQRQGQSRAQREEFVNVQFVSGNRQVAAAR
jgi:hypothetical protein